MNAIYVTIPIEPAFETASARAMIDGRQVPEITMISTHKGVSKVFPKAIKKEMFDTIKLFDTTFSRPLLIVEKRKGEVSVRLIKTFMRPF